MNKKISSEECRELIESKKTLPDNLTVEGSLNLEYCTSLKTLPDNLTIKGNLYLVGCTSLKTLPNNLTVKGYLELAGCSSLKTLPNNLTVKGILFLWMCPSIKSFYQPICETMYVSEKQINSIPFKELPLYLNTPLNTNAKEIYMKRLKAES